MAQNVLKYTYKYDPGLMKGKTCMYLTISQHVYLSKDDFRFIKKLFHAAKI